MPERLPAAELERLCVALGFEAEGWKAVGSNVQGWNSMRFPPLKIGEKQIEYLWPPIDTDDTWARKAMEAATRKAGMAGGVWFAVQPPMTDDYEWGVEVVAGKPAPGAAETTVGYARANTSPLALCLALLAALDGGALGP